MHTERQPVYEALDKLPDMIFAAICYGISGLVMVLALTVVDDPTELSKLMEVMQPFMKKID